MNVHPMPCAYQRLRCGSFVRPTWQCVLVTAAPGPASLRRWRAQTAMVVARRLELGASHNAVRHSLSEDTVGKGAAESHRRRHRHRPRSLDACPLRAAVSVRREVETKLPNFPPRCQGLPLASPVHVPRASTRHLLAGSASGPPPGVCIVLATCVNDVVVARLKLRSPWNVMRNVPWCTAPPLRARQCGGHLLLLQV